MDNFVRFANLRRCADCRSFAIVIIRMPTVAACTSQAMQCRFYIGVSARHAPHMCTMNAVNLKYCFLIKYTCYLLGLPLPLPIAVCMCLRVCTLTLLKLCAFDFNSIPHRNVCDSRSMKRCIPMKWRRMHVHFFSRCCSLPPLFAVFFCRLFWEFQEHTSFSAQPLAKLKIIIATIALESIFQL